MMRVGLTYSGRTEHASKIAPYERALRLVGLKPVRNPASLRGLAGLVLSGGTDVDPALYHQRRAPETDEPDRIRDDLELRLLHEALANGVPVLAICRGMQIVNVGLGGTLNQHLDSTARHRQRGVPDAHEAQYSDGSRIWVNSRHHQAIDRLAEGLEVTAVADDGIIIEAITRGPRLVGVQWHPEDRVDTHPSDLEQFRRFAEVVDNAHAAEI